MGGPVWPGEVFLIGEKGPELVTFGPWSPKTRRADGEVEED